jgi:hypothetical protein
MLRCIASDETFRNYIELLYHFLRMLPKETVLADLSAICKRLADNPALHSSPGISYVSSILTPRTPRAN